MNLNYPFEPEVPDDPELNRKYLMNLKILDLNHLVPDSSSLNRKYLMNLKIHLNRKYLFDPEVPIEPFELPEVPDEPEEP
jgi:hypothetical protein